MLSIELIRSFGEHCETLRRAARQRQESCAFKNVVDDPVQRAVVSERDTLGVRNNSDAFQGDCNLRTLQTLLTIIDRSGWERSPHQIRFHSAFIRCVSRVLYRQDWKIHKPTIMAKNGWEKAHSEVMIS